MEERFVYIAMISFKHDYFRDGIFRFLKIYPTDSTRNVTSELRIVLKPFTGGVHLLVSEDYLSSVAREGGLLRFELRSTDPQFINYTELGVYNPAEHLLCFDNINTLLISESSEYLLDNESFQGASEILRIQNNSISLVRYREEALYTFYKSNGEAISFDFVEQQDIMVNAFTFNDVSEGIIRVYEDDVLMDMFYYRPIGLWNKPFGILEINLGTLVEQYLRDSATVSYLFEFQARKTYWKYFFTQQSETSWKSLLIRCNGIDDDFTRSIADDALTFISKRPMTLSENAKDSFQLVQKDISGNMEDKIIIAQLPHASPNQLYLPENNSNNAYVSHIYIHI